MELVSKNLVSAALKIVGAPGMVILNAIDWKPLREVLEELDSKRGRPFKHEREAILKGFIYGYADGETNILAVWRVCTQGWKWKAFGFSSEPSYDTFRRFLEQTEPLMDELFQELVEQCKAKEIISGSAVAMDTSSLPTIFKNADLDAKWNYDASKDENYYGYAIHLVIDAATQLPLAFDLLRDKKVSYGKALQLWEKIAMKPEILTADSEYDIIKFLNKVLDNRTLPIIEYNPRNTKEPKVEKFRAEIYSLASFEWLNTKYRERSSIERANNTLKNDQKMAKFRVRGYERVRSHCFLHCILRLGYALAIEERGGEVTKTISAL